MLKFSFGETYISPCTLVLGGFDGLHLGHRRLLDAAKEAGLPVVLTTISGAKGKELFTMAEREFVFAAAGVDAVCEIGFTQALKATSAEDFARKLFSTIAADKIVCGEDFRFGKGAKGTAELLQRFTSRPISVQKTVKYLAEESGRARKLSTSACKAYLSTGELSRLNACLCGGADLLSGGYFIQGTVEHGREVGRTYGFPTLNLSSPAEKLLPPDGVYGGVCVTERGTYPTIVNIGARPTFGVTERKIEAYLDGFSGDLYGTRVRIYPTQFYRGIQTFPSQEALRAQLGKDIQRLKESE